MPQNGQQQGSIDEALITEAMIARRAFEISLTRDSVSPDDDWLQAERELRAELAEQQHRSH